MADEIYVEELPPSEIILQATGPPIIVYAGSAGLASEVVISPAIPGFEPNVQSMLTQLAGNAYLFSFGDATPNQILIADVNQLIKTVAISILTPFDGVDPMVSVGDSVNPQRLMPFSAIDPSDAATEWEYTPNHRYSSATPILLTLVPDGSTQGNGVVYIERS